MTRTQAVSLFLAAVLVLTLAVAIFAAFAAQSSLVTTNAREGFNSTTVGVTTPTEPSAIMASNCDGCSGGGSTGG
jgi:hypothetical protein